MSESSSLFNSSYLHLMLALDSQLYDPVAVSRFLSNSSYLHLVLALDSSLYDLVAVSLIFLSPTVHIYTASPTPQIYPSCLTFVFFFFNH